jgi:hypothetical protein
MMTQLDEPHDQISRLPRLGIVDLALLRWCDEPLYAYLFAFSSRFSAPC